MTTQEAAHAFALIQAAIAQAYEDAELYPPTAIADSRIVPLERLVAGQGLRHREHPDLTRGSAATFPANPSGNVSKLMARLRNSFRDICTARWREGRS